VVPLVGTRIRRSAVMVVRRGGVAPVAEIACDEVRFFRPDASGGGSSEPSYEVEVELLGGEERDLRAIVREIRARYRLRASRGSKLERALRWAGVRAPRVHEAR
jgi:inorganic triphosphatase YgiF